MSKISKEGAEQIKIIKNALDSMYDKLGSKTVYIPKGKTSKNIDGNYDKINVFESVQPEFEAIAGIVSMVDEWSEVE